MRVLCLGAAYPPCDRGGYEQQCAGAVAHLRAHGHDVRVLVGDPEPAAQERLEAFRALERFPVPPRRTAPWEAWRAERANARVLEHHLRGFRPDAVCFWRMGELPVSLVERVRRAGVPTVGVVCDPWMLEAPARDPWARLVGRAGPLAPLLARAAGAPPRLELPGPTAWLFVSRHLRGALEAAGLALGEDAGLATAGLEAGAWPAPPPARAERPWGGRLLYVGRLSPLKGVDVAIRALAALGPDTVLTLVGDGAPAYRGELERLADALGVRERVAFLPARPRERLPDLYGEADALLFPVRWAEPWGLVPLEAMACGTPVVATGTGGSAEYLSDEDNALLVAPGDATALAAAVVRLAGDPGLRARLVRAGQRTAERHPAERGHAAVRSALESSAGVAGWRHTGEARCARASTRPSAASQRKRTTVR